PLARAMPPQVQDYGRVRGCSSIAGSIRRRRLSIRNYLRYPAQPNKRPGQPGPLGFVAFAPFLPVSVTDTPRHMRWHHMNFLPGGSFIVVMRGMSYSLGHGELSVLSPELHRTGRGISPPAHRGTAPTCQG